LLPPTGATAPKPEPELEVELRPPRFEALESSELLVLEDEVSDELGALEVDALVLTEVWVATARVWASARWMPMAPTRTVEAVISPAVHSRARRRARGTVLIGAPSVGMTPPSPAPLWPRCADPMTTACITGAVIHLPGQITS
jgi:hypothetical protein